jgi:DNA-binding CsgD family transcriptional regulator
MSKDQSAPGRRPRPPQLSRRYVELYPSLRNRLQAILQSEDPQLRAKVEALAAMVAKREREHEDWLAERYRLTPAEARLAAHIGGGGSVAAYAAGYEISVGTVRTHLKAVFAKVGVHRQADLVRLLADER